MITPLLTLIDACIDFADLFYPSEPVGVFHFQDVFERPVEIVGDVRYLLVDRVRRVAYQAFPWLVVSSTSSGVRSFIFR